MKNRSMGRLGGLFNVVIPGVAACNARGAEPLKNTKRFPITTFGNDVARGYLRGFTLIELLVVVLIIGILSAIALPQYDLAVTKTGFATLQPVVRALADAQEVYYMENGEYATRFSDLSVTLPAGGNLTEEEDGASIYYPKFHCRLHARAAVYCKDNKRYGYYRQHLQHNDRPGRFCVVTRSHGQRHVELLEKLCRSLSGKKGADFTVASDWDFYQLP